jgi:hypothetical protein
MRWILSTEDGAFAFAGTPVGLLALAEFSIARNRNYSFAAELLLLIPEKK